LPREAEDNSSEETDGKQKRRPPTCLSCHQSKIGRHCCDPSQECKDFETCPTKYLKGHPEEKEKEKDEKKKKKEEKKEKAKKKNEEDKKVEISLFLSPMQAKKMIKEAQRELFKVPDIPPTKWVDEEITKRFQALPVGEQTEANKARITREVSYSEK